VSLLNFKDKIESEILGTDVYLLPGVQGLEETKNIRSQILQQPECIVIAKIPLNDISLVHNLEAMGFRFAEVQLQATRKISQRHVDFADRYIYEKVNTEIELEEVINIAQSSITHDRWSMSPNRSKEESNRRVKTYLEKSFTTSLEEIWVLRDLESKEIMQFRSHKYSAPREATLLLGAVRPDLKGLGIGPISWQFCENQLSASGVKRAVTHFSAANHEIINLEVGSIGFRVTASTAVMEYSIK
jgi:hypothetical protein